MVWVKMSLTIKWCFIAGSDDVLNNHLVTILPEMSPMTFSCDVRSYLSETAAALEERTNVAFARNRPALLRATRRELIYLKTPRVMSSIDCRRFGHVIGGSATEDQNGTTAQ